MLPELQSPWKEFLADIDSALQQSVSLHCIGGFVASVRYGLPRPTGDIDYISVQPYECDTILSELAGIGTPLSKKHKLYLQRVSVTILPEEYESRLEEIFPGQFKNLRLFVPDPYDLILSKVERNGPKDRHDVEFLAKPFLSIQTSFANAISPSFVPTSSTKSATISPFAYGSKVLSSRRIRLIELQNSTVRR